MSEMIERVARAIAARGGDDADPDLVGDGYVEMARAAIEAMREPTETMNAAGNNVGDYPWDGKRPSRTFAAMIDAALK